MVTKIKAPMPPHLKEHVERLEQERLRYANATRVVNRDGVLGFTLWLELKVGDVQTKHCNYYRTIKAAVKRDVLALRKVEIART